MSRTLKTLTHSISVLQFKQLNLCFISIVFCTDIIWFLCSICIYHSRAMIWVKCVCVSVCVMTSDYHAVGVGGAWKRAEHTPLDMGVSKATSSRPLVGATGRNNWFSKSVAGDVALMTTSIDLIISTKGLIPTIVTERWARSWSRCIGSQSAGTISHLPGSRLPLLSVRPAVTFPAAEHHRPLPVVILLGDRGT